MSHYLYENGVIHTIPGRAQTDALLIRDGHVAAAGEEAREQAGHARRVDLAGRSIIPGFIDSHCHILSYGLSLLDLDVSPAAARSLADLQQRIAGAAGDWIVGRGYDPDRMAERRQLTRDDLDAAEPHRPVVLWHTSLHAVLCNSRALQRAGIGPDTANPPGSEIVRDTSGRATGVLTENAMGLIADKIPQPNQEQQVQAIVEAMRVMASQGITSASDAATGEGPEIEPTLELYRRALELTLPGRITL
ncbi:MAG TPA: amidohydrolase family protein, partial [Acidobacteriaceae bacterium]|nr:amidohydrolase family protein [Acidobacteriaceae bacterium]